MYITDISDYNAVTCENRFFYDDHHWVRVDMSCPSLLIAEALYARYLNQSLDEFKKMCGDNYSHEYASMVLDKTVTTFYRVEHLDGISVSRMLTGAPKDKDTYVYSKKCQIQLLDKYAQPYEVDVYDLPTHNLLSGWFDTKQSWFPEQITIEIEPKHTGKCKLYFDAL